MMSVAISGGANAQTEDRKESARIFVQQFYDWFGNIYHRERHITAHFVVLKTKPEYIDKKLLDALIADDRASARHPREIIGLGFDPFANSLDNRQGFQTGRVTQKGDRFFVNVHDIRGGQPASAVAKLVLTAEVANMNGRWVFMNFIYPKKAGKYTPGDGYLNDGETLLGALDSVRKDRVKSGRE